MAKRAPDGSATFTLDRTDRRILRVLQEDAKRSDEEIAPLVNLSPSGYRKRRHRLEDAGVIQGYVALVDQEQVGLSEDVFVLVKLHSNGHDDRVAFDEAVKGVDEVMECQAVTGEWDYVLRVATSDLHDHDRLSDSKPSRLPGVERLESLATTRRVVGRRALPL